MFDRSPAGTADTDDLLTSGEPAAQQPSARDERAVRYDAFISYSHAADGKLAPNLQDALQRFAKPWYRRRAGSP